MVIQNKIIKWWVQNVYAKDLTKYEPGFIVSEYNNKYGNAFQRLVSIPEDIIVEIERQVIDKYGEKGKETLRKIGREYGYNFAYTSDAPRISKKGENFVKKYIEYAINYGLSSWAKNALTKKLNFNPFYVEIEYDKHIVCRKNGIGIILTEYTVLGFIEYILEKPVNLKSSKCQGRGDEFCETIFEEVEGKLLSPMLNSTNIKKYKEKNKIQKLFYSNSSLSKMLKNKIFYFKDGILYFKENVIIPFECSLIYLLDFYIAQLDKTDLIKNITYEWGQKNIYNHNLEIFSDFLPALGFGDNKTKISNKKKIIYILHYPWNPLFEHNDNFSFIEGFCSGIIDKKNSNEIFKVSKKINEIDKISLKLEK